MEPVSLARLAPTLTTGILTGLETMLNDILRLDTASSEKLSNLGGRWLQVSVMPLYQQQSQAQSQKHSHQKSQHHSQQPSQKQAPAKSQPLTQAIFLQADYPLRLALEIAGEPDAMVTGSPLALIRYWQSGESAPTLSITGDQNLAKELAQISSGLDVDWENQLAQLIGNLPAHFVGNRLRDAQQWLRYVQQNFFRDAEEYLHHESRALPDQEEVKLWQEAIAALVGEVDELESRLQKLETRRRQVNDDGPAPAKHSGMSNDSDSDTSALDDGHTNNRKTHSDKEV